MGVNSARPFLLLLKGLITIARTKKPDWNTIRAEYIAGGISQRALAAKHKVSDTTLMKRARAEKWNALRKEAERKAVTKTQQEVAKRTADAAAANAVKLEKARALLIDKILKAIEQMPDKSGTRVRQSQMDKNTGKQMSVDYDLSVLVAAFEKLSSGSTADFERQKQFASENNTTLMSYAELFRRPARMRTIEEVEMGDDDV